MKYIYEVRAYDYGDMGDRGRTVGYFFNKDHAEQIKKANSGAMGPVQSMDPIRVFESIEEYDDFVSGAAKQRALAKLTEEEKQLLGLRDK